MRRLIVVFSLITIDRRCRALIKFFFSNPLIHPLLHRARPIKTVFHHLLASQTPTNPPNYLILNMPSTFDLSTLFVADKAARNQAAESLASQSKNESISWFEEIGLTAALVKVSSGVGGCMVIVMGWLM